MDKDKLKAFADKVFGDTTGAMTAALWAAHPDEQLFLAPRSPSRARPGATRDTANG